MSSAVSHVGRAHRAPGESARIDKHAAASTAGFATQPLRAGRIGSAASARSRAAGFATQPLRAGRIGSAASARSRATGWSDAPWRAFTMQRGAGAALLCVSLSAALALLPAALRADDGAEAHITKGIALRREGQNAAALTEFQAAYQLEPSPRAKAQIALAQQALGDWLSAESNLVVALAAEDDSWIQKHTDLLRASLGTVRDHLASVRIETNVAGARLLMQDRPLGEAPLAEAVRVVAGTVRVEARAAGYRNAVTSVKVAAHDQANVRLELLPLSEAELAAANPAPAETPAAAPALESSPMPASPRRAPPQPSAASLGAPGRPLPAGDSSGGLPLASFVTFALGGAALVTGVVANVVRETRAAQWNDDSMCATSAIEPCAGYRRTAETAGTIAIVGYATAGAALATGLILWAATPSEPRATETAHWNANLGLQGAALWYSSRF